MVLSDDYSFIWIKNDCEGKGVVMSSLCRDCNVVGGGMLDSDGKCSECGGAGWTMDWLATFSPILDEEDCHLHCNECNGTGDCQTCDGVGRVDDDDDD